MRITKQMSEIPFKNPNPVSAYHHGNFPREALWQATVSGWFKEDGWLVYHTHDSRRSDAGFPDMVCVLPGVASIFAELKIETGKLTFAQEQWLLSLAKTGEMAYLWRPSDTNEIQDLLNDCRVLSS